MEIIVRICASVMIFAGALAPAGAFAAVALPRVLSSHMVLQRDMEVPVWGTADPNETVTVAFRGQQKSASADAQGKWIVRLDPLPASGEPADLTVTGSNTLTLSDVLVGEVWVGSGQSNMDTDVPDYVKADLPLAEAAGKNHPQLRLFRSDVGNGWQETTPQALRRFSAQLFYFGMKLQQELGVPVGVMEGAVRGSPSAPWINREAFKADPALQKAMAAEEAKNPFEKKMEKYNEALAQWQQSVDAAKAAGTAGDKLPKPPVQPAPPGEEPIIAHFYEQHIRPMIPYAIRGVLWDQGEGGPGLSYVSQRVLMAALIRSWRADWSQGDFPWLDVQKPSGEGCALDPENPINKGAAAFSPLPASPPGWQPGWPPRWDWFGIMKDNPNVFLVSTSDLATGVHPSNKSGYGTRDCQVALGAVYGKPVEFYGPMYQSFSVEGGQLRLSFTHVGRGLACQEGQKLQGFALAGEDKKFYWADAAIEGATVVLSSPKVPAPVAARYAWAPFDITWANLFNKDGLPALGFKTDSW
jgi:sialate O-acetylesterase